MELHVYLCCHYLVISLFLFVTVYAEQTCDNRNCLNSKCTDDRKCLLGCDEGYVSDSEGQCLNPCSDNCSKCENSACADCKPGYFGDLCMNTCDGCIKGLCDRETGQCTRGCRDGYYDEPWCNSTNVLHDDHDHHHHQHHHEKAKTSKLKEEHTSRKLYIWIAGAIIVSVIVAIIAIIVLVVRGREGDAKSSYDMSVLEHLSEHNEDATEIA